MLDVWNKAVLYHLVHAVALFALAPQLVTPPALVPGERLVLAPQDVPALGASPKLIAAPLVDDAHAVWIARLSKDEIVAFRARWAAAPRERECPVHWIETLDSRPLRLYAAECPGFGTTPMFSERGDPLFAPRGLDRYLVSVGDGRVIVNLSRVIAAPERTSAPTPP